MTTPAPTPPVPPGGEAPNAAVDNNTATIRKSLVFYRVMAWVVGVLLVVLICVGMPLKYVAADPNLIAVGSAINTYLGIAHGWLYMLLLISAVNLGRRVAWRWTRLLAIALAGTVPFLSFVAEHFATKDVRRRLAAVSRETSAPRS